MYNLKKTGNNFLVKIAAARKESFARCLQKRMMTGKIFDAFLKEKGDLIMRGRWFTVMGAMAMSLALLFVPQLMDKGLLFDGAESYTFYSQSESSQAQIVLADASEALAVKWSIASLTGESARYEDAEEAFAQAEKYRAELLIVRTVQDVTDYYYYSPCLGGGVVLEGKKVNLHIAVRGSSANIGSPLIFGGY